MKFNFKTDFVLFKMVPGSGGIPTMQRIPLPGAELLEEEPLYVNAKQYHRILKRRQARARLEAEGRIPKERRVSRMMMLLAQGFSQAVLDDRAGLVCDRTKFNPVDNPAVYKYT